MCWTSVNDAAQKEKNLDLAPVHQAQTNQKENVPDEGDLDDARGKPSKIYYTVF